MALTTVTKDPRMSLGNLKGVAITPTFTSVTSGEIKTGLQHVVFAVFIPTTDDGHDTYLNYSDAGSTAAKGSVFINNVTSGATGTLFAIGF